MKRHALIPVILVAFAAATTTAQANTIRVAAKITKKQASRIHTGTLITSTKHTALDLYPSEESPAMPPPIACAWYIDGMGIFWGGAHWTCLCVGPSLCEWELNYIDQDGYPDGYVDRPPSGVCFVGS